MNDFDPQATTNSHCICYTPRLLQGHYFALVVMAATGEDQAAINHVLEGAAVDDKSMQLQRWLYYSRLLSALLH